MFVKARVKKALILLANYFFISGALIPVLSDLQNSISFGKGHNEVSRLSGC
jgi:hypothetical protein